MCLFRLTKLVYENYNYNYNIINIIQKYNMKKNIFRDLTQLQCENEDFSYLIKQKPFRCKECKTELSTLSVEIEAINNRKRKIKRELDKLIKPKTPEELIGFKEVKEIESMDDIQDIIDRMQDLVEKAEEAGKKVQANVELEVR